MGSRAEKSGGGSDEGTREVQKNRGRGNATRPGGREEGLAVHNIVHRSAHTENGPVYKYFSQHVPSYGPRLPSSVLRTRVTAQACQITASVVAL